MAVGSIVSAIGYGGMRDVELEVNERGELIDDKKFRFQPHISRGEITEYYADNFRTKAVSTPGPCFAFSAKIPGGMSGGPIFDREGIYAHGVVSKLARRALELRFNVVTLHALASFSVGNLNLLQIHRLKPTAWRNSRGRDCKGHRVRLTTTRPRGARELPDAHTAL